ncbi:protein kinase [Actinomycetes bacterium KLBMP 9759]
MTAGSATPTTVADYEIVELLGEGNNGRFYRARPPARLGLDAEFVALKVFGEHVSEQAYERGVRELRAFASVQSPYLVRVYDAVLEDRFAYAMEYLPLGSLESPTSTLRRDAVLSALEHAAIAAHALHEAGLAHGDITPGNVLLADDGGGVITGKLADLGLARLLTPGNTLTGIGSAGSVEYMDPDLIGGARPSRRTEIWALGATVHRALSGAGLYGELPADQPVLAIRKVLATTATPHPDLAPDVAELVRDCLADGEARIGTAAEVAERLAQISR